MYGIATRLEESTAIKVYQARRSGGPEIDGGAKTLHAINDFTLLDLYKHRKTKGLVTGRPFTTRNDFKA